MDPDRAIEIVKSLADGVDPFTGERYSSDSPYQNADMVRALYLALDGLDRVKIGVSEDRGQAKIGVKRR